ncbi:acyl-CoA dehydrogenase family protein [Micromonospora sp. CPCC 206061]|uniref:acyl-CoA dehydrogenase family protein n=1 Tax=Micromonospora sp. CPCC 206061 TaxID=3122410 RepID=UPI002FF13BCD
MKLTLSDEQARFAATLHDLLDASDVPAASRAWATGDPAPGRAVWRRLADAGVAALAVPEKWGGLDASPADLAVACEELGHHAVPGPVTETVAAVPALLAALGRPATERWLPALASGDAIATLAAPPWLPYAVDADASDLVLVASPGGAVRAGVVGTALASVDPARRLFQVHDGASIGDLSRDALGRALDLGALACSAHLLGAGRALLETAVGYAKQRTQFGSAIGRFQAVKHALADVAVGLEFARPLVYAAAVTLAPRDVSAAKVACAGAAHRAARAALQVHGAIGYTEEYGLGQWLTRVRALISAWGTSSEHRTRVLATLSAPAEPWS